MNATLLRLELFVADLNASIDFYGRVLGFIMGEQQPDGYTPMHCGPVTIALNVHAKVPTDHPVHIAAGERPGRGVEIVLEVENIQEAHTQVRKQSWPIPGELRRQP